jgi:Fe-S cluster assembly protein SufD
MSVTALSAEPLLRRLEGQPAGEPAALSAARARARERFLRHGLPHRRVEAWKYTDLRPLQTLDLAAPAPPADMLAALRLTGDAVVLVFFNGAFRADLSTLPKVAGLRISGLSDAGEDAALLDDGETPADAMAALNGATARDGAVIRVDAGAAIAVPVQILVLGGGVVRNIVRLGAGASLTLLESFAGTAPLTSSVTRAVLEPGAVLDHAQVAGGEGWHLGRFAADLASGATLRDVTLSAGLATQRNEVMVRLAGEGASCRLAGANLGRVAQHHDYFSHIRHDAPHCNSNQAFRAVVEGRAVSVFQGRVSVAQDAQKTDAQQLHRGLLLSDHAVAYAKPELEILADDVKCSHGATVGDLSAEELFYLRSRGIGALEARRLLVAAFVAELLDGFSGPVRSHLDRAVETWLEGLA